MNKGRILAIVLFSLGLALSLKFQDSPAGAVIFIVSLAGASLYASRLKRDQQNQHKSPVVKNPGTVSGRPVKARTNVATPSNAGTPESKHADLVSASVMRAIDERRKVDPYIGPKLGAKDVSRRLLNAMKTDKGVHVESLLCALGALAGYACQENLRAQAKEKNVAEAAVFTIVKTKDGQQYFFGGPLNSVLAESPLSIWSLSVAAARRAGCKELPDIEEIFKHVSETLGSPSFGIPRTSTGNQAGDTPINYLKSLWPVVFPIVKQYCQKPSEWPLLLGLSIQDAVETGKTVIAPDTALKIVMESAIPMSKVDLAVT